MGIRTTQNPMGTRTFSENVLKIEKCGPDEDYLTVIDVPGIFRITTDNVTTQLDKSLVLRMVQNYIQNEQTIIFAVLPDNVDIVTQEILEMAEMYDPSGQRTLRVLTKPDLHLLGELTDRAFPKLRAETREMLSQARNDLEKLGQSRQTEREQQQYLASVASDFQDTVPPALNADYSSSEVFDIDNFRLAIWLYVSLRLLMPFG
ncbi:interferon-induced GTP-binding protein Mx2 [Beauveria brongniartii RCEF 3172]|uniref:Interferon-induced GTP-binding protein Mx2 n=1 Tax=Beauveria brongniartii RCEF 3172 TaxID=1081107 RepID=A0A166VNF7_9HYPO|nr:interferon-induced GTP-binding protein Mx2 [Beauveria brongniartii RCEF 3172]